MQQFGFCKKCQGWNPYDAKVCEFCHALLATPAVSLQPEAQPNKKAANVLVVLIALFSFAAGYLTGGTWGYSSAVSSPGRIEPSSSGALQPISTFAPEYRAVERSGRREYITGPRGGCYYINRNGNKTYVDRSMCQ